MRRKSPRVVWLPPTNANSIDSATTNDSGVQTFILDAPETTGAIVVGEIPLTIDSQDSPLDPANSLADVNNTGYRLRRVVGKFWVECAQSANLAARWYVCAGIIVRRSDPQTGVSYALGQGIAPLLSPSQIENYGDPWVWRRSWLITNNLNPNIGVTVSEGTEDNYTHGPAVADGPHIDQKTARIVSAEERLFLDVSAMCVSPGVDVPLSTMPIRVRTDIRLLASMRTSSGNRRNASR